MYEKFMKRFFDFCLSFLALVLLSPIALMICIWIKCDSPGRYFLNKKGLEELEIYSTSINFVPC